MTEAYDWYRIPHRVCVKCPDCGAPAEHEFASLARIRRKADVEFFQKSDVFECHFFEDRSGSRWHGALFYHGLNRASSIAIDDLPEGYKPEDWCRGTLKDLGSVTCRACGCRRKHSLKWPEEAFFQIDYKGKVLWAFDRETTTVLLDYVRSERRQREGKWKSFLLHVPTHFLTKKARDEVAKRLGNLLRAGVAS